MLKLNVTGNGNRSGNGNGSVPKYYKDLNGILLIIACFL